jgi:hypothetical protein
MTIDPNDEMLRATRESQGQPTDAEPRSTEPGEAVSKAGWTLSSDNYKRWMIVGPDGLWTMQPVGMISASEAEAICRATLAKSSPVEAVAVKATEDELAAIREFAETRSQYKPTSLAHKLFVKAVCTVAEAWIEEHDGRVLDALREALDPGRDSLTIMDRLRLYVEDPSTFEFSTHDAGEVLDALEPALTAQAALAVPGEVLVPCEPTPEMVAAGLAEIPEEGSEADDIEDAWRAMLAAAHPLPKEEKKS